MRIVVTGGAGFIGSNFVRMHLSGKLKGASSVKVLDSLTYAGTLTNFSKSELSEFQFINGDINNFGLVEKVFKSVDAVVHFAAESHVDRSIAGSDEFVRTNVLGTHTLLQVAKKINLGNFLHVSTDEVYGSIETGSWDEDDPLLPNSPYAASKASSDLLVRSFFRTFGMNVKITRCSNNYGQNQFPEKIIPLFVTNLLQDKQIPLYGDGLNVRDWLHVDDHCRGINSVLLNGRAGEIYNIGGGRELTNLELTKIILKEMQASEESIMRVQDRAGHDRRYSVNWNKINQELGYQPKIGFDEGIKEVISWYKEHHDWWMPLKNLRA